MRYEMKLKFSLTKEDKQHIQAVREMLDEISSEDDVFQNVFCDAVGIRPDDLLEYLGDFLDIETADWR